MNLMISLPWLYAIAVRDVQNRIPGRPGMKLQAPLIIFNDVKGFIDYDLRMLQS